MSFVCRAQHRWTLADLIDFEAVLAATGDEEIAADRALFARDIRPRLPADGELARRRQGLWRWLTMRRERAHVTAGGLWNRGLSLLRLTLFLGMGLAGFALAAGLCVGAGQSVNVIVFFGLTLVLPWSVFALWTLTRVMAAQSRGVLARGLALVIRLAERGGRARHATQIDVWRQHILDSGRPRRALAAAFGGTLQFGGLGFGLGLLIALVGCLMVFDVRFYWESTPQTGPLMAVSTAAIALPWRWAWPAAVPDEAAIEASRARYVDGVKRLPNSAAAAAAWWRFLLLAIVAWGVLPRLLLLGLYRWRQSAALARLDFQAPRHRALWRALIAVERGPVAAEAADGALVLDVGGSGIVGADLRGFLLRALRVNPQADRRVNVLDDDAEASADAALGAQPAHVVLLVEDWSLSPREVAALHARVREAAGDTTPMTWVVLGVRAGAPTSPDAERLARWMRFVDDLRDPSTEIIGYVASV